MDYYDDEYHHQASNLTTATTASAATAPITCRNALKNWPVSTARTCRDCPWFLNCL